MKLKQWLTKTKLSDAEFARQIGISRSMVSRLVAGDRKPSFSVLQRIVKQTLGAVRFEDLQ